jgi:hypothetical protein
LNDEAAARAGVPIWAFLAVLDAVVTYSEQRSLVFSAARW